MILHAEDFLKHSVFLLKKTFNIVCRWNVKRKWRQAVEVQSGLGSDEQLDEAYMDELEQQVIKHFVR